MCGRYALFVDSGELAEEFGLRRITYDATYNAAPSQHLPVVLDDDPEVVQSALGTSAVVVGRPWVGA